MVEWTDSKCWAWYCVEILIGLWIVVFVLSWDGMDRLAGRWRGVGKGWEG